MYIESSLVLSHPALAQMYYAIRSLDKKGCGWVVTTCAKLEKITGLAYSTVQKRLGELHVQSIWASAVTKFDGQVFIKYNAVKKIVGSLQQAGTLRESVKTSISKRLLKDRKAMETKALLAVAVHLQIRAEVKLEYLINRGKLPWRETNGTDKAPELIREAEAKRFAEDGISYDRLSIIVPRDVYTVGVSQDTIAKAVGLSRKTVSGLLRGVDKVQIYKDMNRADTYKDDSIIDLVDIKDNGDYSIKHLKPMPYLYRNPTRKTSAQKRAKKRARKYKLSAIELKVLKLTGITKGFPYTDEGAIAYLESYGYEKFKKRAGRIIKQMEPTSEFMKASVKEALELQRIAKEKWEAKQAEYINIDKGLF